MSAIVCGKRSCSFFEELSSPPLTSSSSKRVRYSSSSPTRGSIHRTASSPLGLLRTAFPDMDQQILKNALEASGDDLDLAIKSLNELHLRTTDGESNEGSGTNIQLPTEGVAANNDDYPVPGNLHNTDVPVDGSEWVELFVREMTHASGMDDAKIRTSRVLKVLERNIREHANAEAIQCFQKEKLSLMEQVEGLLRDNSILKRAVAIQHERQREYEARGEETQHLKHLVTQYQEKVRSLEVNNYALTLHLRQAEQSSSIPGHFHPDVF